VVERIAAAARKAGKPVCVFAAGKAEIEMLERHGATAFVVSSDQGFLAREAARALQEFRDLGKQPRDKQS
jgi:2-keto-3-deoxy-L-rhamnonate aldolase RhmA